MATVLHTLYLFEMAEMPLRPATPSVRFIRSGISRDSVNPANASRGVFEDIRLKDVIKPVLPITEEAKKSFAPFGGHFFTDVERAAHPGIIQRFGAGRRKEEPSTTSITPRRHPVIGGERAVGLKTEENAAAYPGRGAAGSLFHALEPTQHERFSVLTPKKPSAAQHWQGDSSPLFTQGDGPPRIPQDDSFIPNGSGREPLPFAMPHTAQPIDYDAVYYHIERRLSEAIACSAEGV